MQMRVGGYSRQRKQAQMHGGGGGRSPSWDPQNALWPECRLCGGRWLLIAGRTRKSWVWCAEGVMCWAAMLVRKGRGDEQRQDEERHIGLCQAGAAVL